MADRIEIRDVTIPAGTLSTAPQVTSLTWRQGYPVRVELRFPPGPSGLVGVKLRHSGVEVIPKSGSAFLIADNEIVGWDIESDLYQPNWQFVAYNEGVYDHTIQIRMLLNELGRPSLVRVANVPLQLPTTSQGALLEGIGG
jgi:hypothetical protein